jgi:hypothetical protein
VASIRQDRPFKGRQFTAEVILWAVRWYLGFIGPDPQGRGRLPQLTALWPNGWAIGGGWSKGAGTR